MCGIYALVNFTGQLGLGLLGTELGERLLGLKYRGYESAGCTLVGAGERVFNSRRIGRASIEEVVESLGEFGRTEAAGMRERLLLMGHTRWPTHGGMSEANTHPIRSDPEAHFEIVLNGIVSNFGALKEITGTDGYEGDTDVEVVARLFLELYRRPELRAELRAQSAEAARGTANPHEEEEIEFAALARLVVAQCEGSFAMVVMSRCYPDELVAYSRRTPLYLGLYEEAPETTWSPETRTFAVATQRFDLSSDSNTLSRDVRSLYAMSEDDMAVWRDGALTVALHGSSAPTLSRCEDRAVELYDGTAQFNTFMEKEIHEQSAVARRMIADHLVNGALAFPEISGALLATLADPQFRVFYFVGVGSSFHSAQIIAGAFNAFFGGHGLTARALDAIALVDTREQINGTNADGKPRHESICFFLSQSGETKNTLDALEWCIAQNAQTVAIVNVPDSQIPRRCAHTLLLRAGTERSVASTKAFTSQCLLGSLLAAYLATVRDVPAHQLVADFTRSLPGLPKAIEAALAIDVTAPYSPSSGQPFGISFVDYIAHSSRMIATTRGAMLPVAAEAALKIIEIVYVQITTYDGGSFMHGPLALCDASMSMICIEPADPRLRQKFHSNIIQVQTRAVRPFIIAAHDSPYINSYFSAATAGILILPPIHQLLQGIAVSVVAQNAAYRSCLRLGQDSDFPRSLAKAITVE